MSWQRSSGYNRRSLVETAIFRYKTVIGRRLHARNQRTEAKVARNVLNRMTGLGMPDSAPDPLTCKPRGGNTTAGLFAHQRVAGACHAAMASSVIHTVRLPRLTSAASYSGQFVTRYFALGILWRRDSLNLYGIDLARGDSRRPYRHDVNLAIGPIATCGIACTSVQPPVYSCTNAVVLRIRQTRTGKCPGES
jgi:hypothetical protein